MTYQVDHSLVCTYLSFEDQFVQVDRTTPDIAQHRDVLTHAHISCTAQ